MTLKEIVKRGYKLQAWTMRKSRGQHFIAIKLSRMTERGERFYEVHSPQVETVLADVEFTAPELLPDGIIN